MLLFPSFTFAYTVTVNNLVTGGTGNVINSVSFASSDTAKGAQSFTTVAAGSVSNIALKVVRAGTSATNFYVRIETSSSNLPSGTSLGTSTAIALSAFPAIVSGSCVTTAPAETNFVFPTPIAVSASTRYFAVLTSNGVYDTVNNPNACGDTTSAHSEVAVNTTANEATWGNVHANQAIYEIVTVNTAANPIWTMPGPFSYAPQVPNKIAMLI